MENNTGAQDSGKKRSFLTKDFLLIVLINFFVFINHIMALSTFPFYINELGGNEAISGFAAALFCVIAVICRPFIGWMLNNGRRKIILFIGLLLMGLMPLGYLAAPYVSVLLLLRMLHGAGLAASTTTTSTVATDLVPPDRFAEGMGIFGMSTALATAAAPAIGLGIMKKAGFGPLYIATALAALAAVLLFYMLRTKKVEVVPTKLELRGLINKEALPASASALLFMMSFGALENFTALYADEKGLPSGSIFFLIMAAVLLFTRMFLGKVADTKGEGLFVYSCNFAMLAALVMMALAPSVPTYVISAALSGYAFGGLEPALQTMAVRIAPLKKRGSANSTFLCAYDIGYGIGGALAGVLITEIGYSGMWLIIAAADLASVLVYLAWGRNHESAFRNWCSSADAI